MQTLTKALLTNVIRKQTNSKPVCLHYVISTLWSWVVRNSEVKVGVEFITLTMVT
jgi:hypothetical protein